MSSCGVAFLEDEILEDMDKLMGMAGEFDYNFMVTPLVRPATAVDETTGVPPEFTHEDLVVKNDEAHNCLVGKFSSWINCDAEDPALRAASETAMARELDWAIHLGLPAVIIDGISLPCTNLARVITKLMEGVHYRQIWVRVRMDDEAQWKAWDTFRKLCGPTLESLVFVAIEMTSDLPDMSLMKRWKAEPVKGVIIPTDVFLTNDAGFPVLSRSHQGFLTSMLRLNIQTVVESKGPAADAMHPYQQYMMFLWRRHEETYGSLACTGYEDVLQAPLQPLQDNLESQTYATFERDSIKYELYQRAITQALLDRDADKTHVIMVLGAGRGPLVDASLKASIESNRKVRVYCLEKNPNALLTLRQRQRDQWKDAVTVYGGDMREWDAPELADIIVSELLGSWGDNELSPECLDGAQRLLNPDGGISIPASYTSFLAPLTAHYLHGELRRGNKRMDDKMWETPYVVYLNNVNVLTETQPAFTFVHPNPDEPIDNDRYGTWTFEMDAEADVHGFAGYFESVLYGDVIMSTHPPTHSPNMYSWFPIYFPIKSPIRARAGDTVEISVWRKSDAHRVWYEWCFTQPEVTHVHNADARSYFIGL